ncbi:MAG TPA: Ig-like domain repeat protein, partial [Acidobacteriaceae bacterium]|nr:Ig-like domain repeat protein [Acidobacteriaceae bacterium]
MNAAPGCSNASATRSRFTGSQPRCRALLVASALILLCAWATSLHAQTAAFNGGITTTINASFKGPMGVTTDPNGNIFVADNNTSTNTATVYEMTRNGPGSYGSPVALPSPAGGFVCPSPVTEPDPCLRGLGLDSRGDLWVAAFGNFSTTAGHVYEWVNTSGTFATPVAIGTGWKGPWGIAGDPSGNVFVSDNIANTISKISFSSGQPVVTTVVAANVVAQPRGIAVDASDNIFVIDGNLDHLEKLQSPYTSESSLNNYSFQGPGDLARDAQGNLWLSEFGTNLIREATSTLSNTVAGWGRGFSGPVSVWPAPDGTILVSDWTNHAIKQIVPQTDNVGTVAVGSSPVTQTLQFTFTSNTPTTIKAPKVVTQGASGLDFTDLGTGTCNTNGTSRSYDASDSCTVNVSFKPKSAGIRHGAAQLISNAGTVLATAPLYATGVGPQLAFAGGTFPGTFLTQSIVNPQGLAVDGTGNIYFSSGSSVTEIPPGCATSACRVTMGGGFSQPRAIAVDGAGNLYVADSGSNAVKLIPPGCASSSCVTTVSGFNQPRGVAVDNGGTIYVADTANNAIKKVVAGCSFSTCVSTLASGFNQPQGVAVDGNGNVFVADTSNSAIKEIPAGCTSSSCVITLGGGFSTPVAVAVDGVGDIYTADNHTASVMAPGCGSSSCVTTVRQNSAEGYTGIAVDGSGSVYLSDSLGSGIYTLQLASPPSLTFANTHAGSQSSDSPQTVTLRNIGNAPLTFPVPGTGTNPSISANFKLDSSTTCPDVLTSSPAGTLAAGTSCGLAIDFLPTAIGSVSGSTVLTDNNLNASPSTTQSIALSGTGTSAVPTPTVTVAPSPSSITTTQSLAVTVTLSGGSGNPVPTGTVSLSGPGYSGSPLTLSSGSATFNIPANTLSVGTDTLTASYSGDTNYTTASGSNSVTVTKATPTVTASANPTTITTLQSTVVTVSVAGTPQATGTITLTSAGVTVGTGSLASGAVQITVAASALAVGADTLTATYSGDGVYTTATGSTSVTVNKATPTVTASPNPATITTLQSTVVTVSVAGTPQPTGTITLTSGGVTVGTGSLAAGSAQITVAASALAVGTDSLTATYSGDGTYATATGTTSVTVNKATPTVTASPNPATITTLQSTVVTVSVAGTPQPTGTITLTNGGVTVGSGSLAAGSAQITVPASALAVGANTLTATYSGDGTYTTATGTTSVTVNKATPTVTASPNPATITTLQSTVVTVSVAGTTQPTGTITLTSAGVTVGNGSLVSGTAQITVPASALALGTNSLTASYSGDSNYDIATGSTSVTVTKATPTVSVTPAPATITTLQSTVVTVTVAGTTQPTGTITLTSGGVSVGSGALVSGTAQVNISASALTLGSNTLTASYSGDSNYDIAAGSGVVTIIKATPTVSASANPATITNSQSTVVTVSVDGSVQATGTITLTSGGVTVGSGPLNSGAAQITVPGSALALGT